MLSKDGIAEMGKLEISFQYFVDDRLLIGERLVKFLESTFPYHYNDMTKVIDMLKYLRRKAELPNKNPYDDELLIYRFTIINDGEYLSFSNPQANLFLLLNYLDQINGRICLYWETSIPGGACVGELDGIKYIIRTNESNHPGRAHVHIEYGGYTASISLDDLSILAGKLPSRIAKQAQRDIEHNWGFLLGQWNKLTSGIEIPTEGFFIDRTQKKMVPVPMG